MTELEGVEKWWEILSIDLSIPMSKRDEIHHLHPDSDEQCLRSLITHWLSIHPSPSWRALIRILESSGILLSSLIGGKEKLERICSYAEPLTGMTAVSSRAYDPLHSWYSPFYCMGQLENVQSGESIHLLISVFFGPHLRLTSKGFCHRFSPKWYNTCMCDDSVIERVMTHASPSLEQPL